MSFIIAADETCFVSCFVFCFVFCSYLRSVHHFRRGWPDWRERGRIQHQERQQQLHSESEYITFICSPPFVFLLNSPFIPSSLHHSIIHCYLHLPIFYLFSLLSSFVPVPGDSFWSVTEAQTKIFLPDILTLSPSLFWSTISFAKDIPSLSPSLFLLSAVKLVFVILSSFISLSWSPGSHHGPVEPSRCPTVCCLLFVVICSLFFFFVLKMGSHCEPVKPTESESDVPFAMMKND